MITVGKLAKLYGMLPSEVALKATTYDLMITDILASYEQYEYNKAMGKPTEIGEDDYTEDELTKIMESIKK